MKTILHTFTLLAAALFCSCQSSTDSHLEEDSLHTNVKTDTAKKASGPSHLYGIDISVYQGDEIDFLTKNTDSLSFIICRATLGLTVTDADFKTNWSLIQQKGFIRGAYHFYECDDDPEAQAQHYLSVIGTLSPDDLPPVLDFEQAGLAGVTDKAKIQNDLLTFLNAVQAATGRTPMIYVSPDFADEYLTDAAFAKYPLYVADYNGQSAPAVPALWKQESWTFWQKTDTVKIDNHVDDFDVFNGTAEMMQAFIHK
jgi:lysozyme